MGQILAVRPDLIGESLAAVLAKFQDNLSPFSHKKVQQILTQEFGENFTKIFSQFNFTPVASASIAQVHKATLQDGTSVAVKILRPQIAQIMARDISTLKLLIKILPLFSKHLAKGFSDIANVLTEVSKSELDLLQEAANASRLKEDLKDVKGFYVPQIFWKFSTAKILVLEWLDGIPFSNKAQILAAPFDKKQIAQNLVISYFNQVYANGFFHADMHQGNLFLLKNGDIGVVDFGIVGQIDKKTRLAVAEILIGFLNKDYQRVAQLHIDAGLVPSDTKVDRLALSCRKIGETIVGANVKDISVAKLLANLITMTREYKMDARPELLLLQKTILLVEGVGLMLDPNLNIWDLARPWVKDWAKKNLGFDAKIRDAMVDLFELAKKFLRNV
ncbi:MAG: 2-polyprenylphenol 6-hydroxylase [Rickettsiales bacterium]|nr:2-polyprenylphenol 6-hydroxylase [Rickettsiales bacterium]